MGTSTMTAGSTPGTNAYLSYAVAPNVYLSVGRYMNPAASAANMTFVAVDMDIPSGLFQ